MFSFNVLIIIKIQIIILISKTNNYQRYIIEYKSLVLKSLINNDPRYLIKINEFNKLQ